MKYTQLTKKERYDLELLMQEYCTQKMVAEQVDNIQRIEEK